MSLTNRPATKSRLLEAYFNGAIWLFIEKNDLVEFTPSSFFFCRWFLPIQRSLTSFTSLSLESRRISVKNRHRRVVVEWMRVVERHRSLSIVERYCEFAYGASTNSRAHPVKSRVAATIHSLPLNSITTVTMTSYFAPQYERIHTLHSQIRQSASDFHSLIASCSEIKDHADHESKDNMLRTAFSGLRTTVQSFDDAMDRLQHKVNRMATETNNQKAEKTKEDGLLEQLVEAEEEDLYYDQVYLKGRFLTSMRDQMTNALDDALCRVKSRIQRESILTSPSHSTHSTVTHSNQFTQSAVIQPDHSMANFISNDLPTILTRLSGPQPPVITLTPFDGESTQWESFYSQFTSIIESKSHISDHEKLVHLRNALKGSALRAVQGIPTEAKNLKPTIDRLKSVFGKSKRSNTILINQLFAIRPKSSSFEHQLECTQDLINKIHQLDDKSLVDNFALINQIAGTIHSKHLEKMYKEKPSTMMEALELIESDLREIIEISKLKSTFSSTRSDHLSYQKQKGPIPVSETVNSKPFIPKQSLNNQSCVYCGQHKYSLCCSCTTITSISERKAILKEKKLCFKCLSPHPFNQQCDRKCKHCSRPHHNSICDSNFNNSKLNQSSVNAVVTTNQPVNGVARLFTASALLQNPVSNQSTTRHVLLDTGGMMSIISRSLATELNLKSHRTEPMCISGVGGESTGSDVFDVVKVNILTSKGSHSIEALVMDTVITRSMNLKPLSAQDYAVVQAHCGNHPHLTENTIVSPDLLISITETQDLLADSTTIILPSGYKLVQSILGPMITGRTNSQNSSIQYQNNILTSLITDASFETRVSQFLSVDETAREYSTTEAEARSDLDHKVEENFHNTTHKVGNHYQVQYYLKPEITQLPTNKELSFSRLKSTVNSLIKNSKNLEFYDSIIKDQLSAGMIEETNSLIPTDHQCHYLAHQAVLRPDKPTTPLRIVYDASAKLKGKLCLNDVIAQDNYHLVNQLINNVYVDNIIINTDLPTQEIYSISKSLFNEMHMNLRDYASNSLSFIQSVSETDRAPIGVQKLLGIHWDPSTDDLSIRIPSLIRHTAETKRSMLSTIASIYDPLGLLQPLTLQAKSLVQQLWCDNLKWDQSVNHSIQSQFHELLSDIESFNLTIPRYSGMSTAKEIHLIAFADASKLAMGAVIYLWTSEKTTLLMSRIRLAPVKNKATIPKLELNALVMAHTLLQYVVKAIQKEFPTTIIHTHVYSDSAITLFWCLSDPNSLSSIDNIQFHSPKYVRTECNPADLITRGLTSIVMNNHDHMWWKGAPWMKESPETWPNDPVPLTADPPYTRVVEFSQSPLIDLTRYSTLNKAIRITGFILRFVQRTLKNSTNITLKQKYDSSFTSSSLLSAFERTRALQSLIRNHQSCHIKHHEVWIRNGLISQDDYGIWRANTRLDHAAIQAETRRPILIPSNEDSRLARLIIDDTHEFMFHAGTENVLNQLKQQYWIPRSRQLTRNTQ
ncbi:hypothetical protein PRIPAC_95694 [Pristionchus pacificus]|uniref:Peptidase A2 domain-containing protein n=1 Tax=Pristionchus pacificus TaxID=54126 RepID=A0A2A6CU67_PRIPA|nr:hypothetical protein PRIPAC_95694 [Pristionchus pacificus]|eukprot:PDM81626.1 hypothetical protein PRIPAC_30607 [Pristionchus pacificus]